MRDSSSRSTSPVPFRLVTGGTRADDVVVLRSLLAERLALRGLTGSPGGPSTSAPASGQPDSWPVAPCRPAAAPASEGPGRVPARPGEPEVLVPVGPQEDHEAASADMRRRLHQVPGGTDLIVRTSGSSTGTGRLVAASAASLVASAQATHARLGGPGRWVLALPCHHVAGLQVLVRSVLAGTEPVVVDTSAGFRAPALAHGLRRALGEGGPDGGPDGVPAGASATAPGGGPGGALSGTVAEPTVATPAGSPVGAGLPVYVSLVPTQLVRVLQDEEATRVLAGVSAVLLGGAAASPALLERARAAGVPVVTTYGASETGGGCVYDGWPLDGVEVALDAEGRVLLSGPVLASGYVGDDAGARDLARTSSSQQHADCPGRALREPGPLREACAVPASPPSGAAGGDLGQEAGLPPWQPGATLAVTVRPGFHRFPDAGGTQGVRVLATSDRGGLEGGRLRVLGRMDGLISTGGVKVDPREVEDVLTRLDGVAEACVVGVPDEEWGAVVAAAVVAQPGAGLEAGTVRRAAREVLEGPHAPRRVEVVEALPLVGPGKVDRLAVRRLLSLSWSGL